MATMRHKVGPHRFGRSMNFNQEKQQQGMNDSERLPALAEY